MKKLISLLSILFLITLFVPFKQAEADRGSGGFRGDPGGAEDFMDLEGMKDSAEMVTMGDSVEMVAIEDFVGMGGSYPDCLSVVF